MKAMDRVLIALLVCGAAVDAQAGCDQPPLVMIPAPEDIEGNEAQVVAGTEQYFLAMQEYVNCIRAELESAGDDASELYRRVLVQRNNLAVAEAEAVQRWLMSRLPDAAAPQSTAEPREQPRPE